MVSPYKSLIQASLFLSIALMLGRLAGFAREIMLASTFGLSTRADLAIVLLTLPDLLVNLLLSGGLAVALIPALRSVSSELASSLYIQTSIIVGVLFGVLGLSFVIVPQLWVSIFAPGITMTDEALEPWTLYMVAAALLLTALSGVSTAALNAKDYFFLPGCGTLIFNVCVIVALWIGVHNPRESLLLLGVGIFAGAFLRWFTQVTSLMSATKISVSGAFGEWEISKKLLITFGTGLASVSLLILIPVIIRALASLLGEGQLAAFNYSIKLVELPLGILITTLATVAFPRLSEMYSTNDTRGFDMLLYSTLRKAIVLSFAITIFGILYIDSLVNLLFSSSRLSMEDRMHIVDLAKIALLSVPAVGVSSLAAAALNASEQASMVLRKNTLALILLPLFCLPGLFSGAASTLMWSLPAVHLVLAVVLSYAAGLRCLGPNSCFNQPTILALLSVLIVFLLSLYTDMSLRNLNEYSRIAIGFLTFLAASVAAYYFLIYAKQKK